MAEVAPPSTADSTNGESPMTSKPLWESDSEAKGCLNCGKTFGLRRRRHHCRACGKVFCDDCSTHKHELPECYGYKGKQRCCDACHLAILKERMNNQPEEDVEIPDFAEVNAGLKQRLKELFLDEKPWVKKTEKKGVTIFVKKLSDSNLFCVRSTIMIKASLAKTLTVYSNKEAWRIWQPDMKKCSTIEKLSRTEELMYVLYKVPVISDRDVLSYNSYMKGHVLDESKSETRSIISTSVHHPLCPKVKGVVRAHINVGCTSFEEVEIDGKIQTKIESVFHTDPKGLIPPAVVNQGISRAVDQLVNMAKYIEETDIEIPSTLPGDEDEE